MSMDNKINRYLEPRCSVVEMEVDGTILSASGLSQGDFKLENYEDLKDVQW